MGAENRSMGVPLKLFSRLICLGFLLFFAPLFALTQHSAQAESGGNHPFREPSLERGAPFSLNAYDAVHALYLLRRELFLQVRESDGNYRTVRIQRVRALRLPDAKYPLTPFERKRYDILVNGEPLDWENSYIEYDERRVNLRLLYTYRNGALPEGLLYEGPP